MAEIKKLSETQNSIIQSLATASDYTRVFDRQAMTKTTKMSLYQKGLITLVNSDSRGWWFEVALTEAGIEYATAQGWIEAPVTTPREPLIDTRGKTYGETEYAPTPAANTETVSAKAVKLSAAQERIIKAIATLLNTNSAGFDENGYTGLRRIRYASITTAEVLQELELLEIWHDGIGYTSIRVRLTELGKQYAIERGWLAAPANSEPQAANVFGEDDSIPQNVIEALAEARELGKYNMLDRESVIKLVKKIDTEAGKWLNGNKNRYMDALLEMGKLVSAKKSASKHTDTAANTQDKHTDDSVHSEDAQPEGALTDDERARNVLGILAEGGYIVGGFLFNSIGQTLCSVSGATGLKLIENKYVAYSGKYLIITDAGRTALAIERTALAQTAPVDGGSDEPDYPTDYTPYVNTNPDVVSMDDLPAQFKAQQAEIRTLESKLAAAGAIEQRLLSEWVAWHDSYEKVIGHYIPTEIVNQMKMLERILGYTPDREGRKPLAALQQSGAGEG